LQAPLLLQILREKERKVTENSLNLALIYGSARAGRFCDRVAEWTAAQVAKAGNFSITIIDPAVDDGPDTVRRRVAEANAFVVVTPEYNHGYPAPLKSLIDSVGAEWHAKPVAFVSYGGASGGLRAVEQLRLVFAELHAVTMRDAVSFASAWEQFDGCGTLREPDRAERSMTTMLNRLRWWAVALRNARQETPYLRTA
jgi:NAD(P)H-dependent FMN reductase